MSFVCGFMIYAISNTPDIAFKLACKGLDRELKEKGPDDRKDAVRALGRHRGRSGEPGRVALQKVLNTLNEPVDEEKEAAMAEYQRSERRAMIQQRGGQVRF